MAGVGGRPGGDGARAGGALLWGRAGPSSGEGMKGKHTGKEKTLACNFVNQYHRETADGFSV